MLNTNGNHKPPKHVSRILRLKGYPENSIDKTKHLQSHQKDSQPLNTEWSYLKIPYFSERLNYKITNIFRKEGGYQYVSHTNHTPSDELSPTTPRSVHAPGTIAPSLTPNYAY